MLLGLDRATAEAVLPKGFQAMDGPGAAVVALNRCTFRVRESVSLEPEVFVWLAVTPPATERLLNGTHAWEAFHWRPAGPTLQAMGEALPRIEAARFEGFDEALSGDFAVTMWTGGEHRLRVSGMAAAMTSTVDHPEGAPCCRTFAQGAQGLVRVDYTSSDQPFGEARCTVETDIPGLVALLGAARAEGPCVHHPGYSFRATIAPAGANVEAP